MDKRIRWAIGAVLVVVLLTGVVALTRRSNSTYYSTRLKLPVLPEPEAKADAAEFARKHPKKLGAEADIRSAATPAAADGLASQLDTAERMAPELSEWAPTVKGYEAKSKESLGWALKGISFQHRAAQIKRAQLEDGDASDRTGEVEENLRRARQCYANAGAIEDTIPTPTPEPTMEPMPTFPPIPTMPPMRW